MPVVRTKQLSSIATILINAADIISNQEINIINDIHAIDQLNNLTFTNIDVKRVFYFHIIKGICEYIDSSISNKSHTMYYSSCDLKFLELNNYIENYKLKQFLDGLTGHIMNVLPVKFYTTNLCFDKLAGLSINSGEYRELINTIKNNNNKHTRHMTTQKTRKYLTNQGFTYLNEKYFTKYKHMMFFYK